MTNDRDGFTSGDRSFVAHKSNRSDKEGETPRRRQTSRRASKDDSSVSRWANWVLVLAFCGCLIWAPIPLGSNRDWFAALLFTGVGCLLLAWFVLVVLNYSSPSHRGRALWPAAALLSVVVAFASFQVVDLRVIDAAMGTKLSGELAHPVWALGSEALETQLPAFVSVNPAKAFPAILKILFYAAVFYLAFEFGRRRQFANAIVWAVILGAGLNAVLGVVQSTARIHLGELLAGTSETIDLVEFGGTFGNQNHFATFAAMGLIATLSITYDVLTKNIVVNRGRTIALRTAVNAILGPALLGLSMIFLLAGAIILSGSRAGSFVMVVGCIVFVAITAASRKSSQTSGTLSNGLLLGIVAIGAAVASAPLLSRVEQSGIIDDARTAMAAGALDAAMAAPFTGNGLGAFIDYYPLYATRPLNSTANAAHNDYLEVLGDLGLIGGAALLLVPAYLLFLCLSGIVRRRRGRHFALIGACAGLICGIHALVDFSLQIPAVGMTLFALLGVGAAQSWSDEANESHDPRMAA